jgi:hypothetical protein
VLLVAGVALFIVIGGGAAMWSLLREIYAAPSAPQGMAPAAPEGAASPVPSPPVSTAAP